MRNRFGLGICLVAALAALSIVRVGAAPQSAAQNKPAKAFDPHDLSGIVWEAPVRVTTGNEISPMTAWGKEQFNANKPFNGPRMIPLEESNDPMIKCDPLGFPRNLFYEIRHTKFVQTPAETVQLFQYQAIWREIWTDGRTLPTNIGKSGGADPRWYGYSVGKWDGDTFVVNTAGIDDRSWLDAYGDPHSGDMLVEERYTRQDLDHLKLTVMINDPKAYTKPFLAQPGLIFRGATKPGVTGAIAWSTLDLPEQMCVPSESANYLGLVAAPAAGKK
jgi:hypothetical protein